VTRAGQPPRCPDLFDVRLRHRIARVVRVDGADELYAQVRDHRSFVADRFGPVCFVGDIFGETPSAKSYFGMIDACPTPARRARAFDDFAFGIYVPRLPVFERTTTLSRA